MKRNRKIAVLRANGIGDFVFALPALQALRASFPADEIVYLGKKLHRELLAGRSSPVDRVIVVPPYPGVGEAEDFQADKRQVDEFFAAMQAEDFDVAIQIHGGGRHSNPFLLRIGADLTLGLQTADAVPLDISVPYLIYFSEMLRYLEVVSYLGARPAALPPRLEPMERDRQEAAAVLPDQAQPPYAVIHPGAGDLRRRWPPASFIEVADRLCAEGLTVCINGAGREEGGIAAEIAAGTKQPGRVHDLSNRLSLRGLVGLLAGAELMISNDSGPLHLAHALQVPSVGIYLACNIINAMPMAVSRSRPLISWITRCPLCATSLAELETSPATCAHEASFAAGVSVEQVIEAAADLRRHPAPGAQAASQAGKAMHASKGSVLGAFNVLAGKTQKGIEVQDE